MTSSLLSVACLHGINVTAENVDELELTGWFQKASLGGHVGWTPWCRFEDDVAKRLDFRPTTSFVLALLKLVGIKETGRDDSTIPQEVLSMACFDCLSQY